MEVRVETVERQEAMDAEAMETEAAAADAIETEAIIDGHFAEQDAKKVEKVELPEETREEINARIIGNWELLSTLNALPQVQKPPEHYMGPAPIGVAREFADFLSRLVLKAERANR